MCGSVGSGRTMMNIEEKVERIVEILRELAEVAPYTRHCKARELLKAFDPDDRASGGCVLVAANTYEVPKPAPEATENLARMLDCAMDECSCEYSTSRPEHETCIQMGATGNGRCKGCRMQAALEAIAAGSEGT